MPRLAPKRRDAPKSAPRPKRNSASWRKAKAVLDRPASPPADMSDEPKITQRCWRGCGEPSVKALEHGHPCFATFRARPVSVGSYEVEIRSLAEQTNSCGGRNHVNGLGTCKHIEAVIAAMLRGWDTREDDG
jgi:hypothetical protein